MASSSGASWPTVSSAVQQESSRETKFVGQSAGFQCGRRPIFGVLAMAALMLGAVFIVAVGFVSSTPPTVRNGASPDPFIYAEKSGDSAKKADDSKKSDDHSKNKADKSKDKTGNSEEKCPPCAPKEKQVPDVVIPFFERDLCKLKYTARSISVSDPDKNLGTIYLMWVSLQSTSKYMNELNGIVDSIAKTHEVHLMDFSPLVVHSGVTGWFVQQFLKLKIASIIQSEYYIVMDAKNTLISPVKADTFFDSCNRGKMYAKYLYHKIPMPHIQWYNVSARILGVDGPEKIPHRWPASVTPVVIHRPTVLGMLAAMGEEASIYSVCGGPLCELFGVFSVVAQNQDHSTEFTLYNMYAYSKIDKKCAIGFQKPEPWNSTVIHRWSIGLWRGVAGQAEQMNKLNLEMLNNLKTGFMKSIMIGAQPGALENMDEKRKTEAVQIVVDLYKKHAGYNPSESTPEELVNCVIGKHN